MRETSNLEFKVSITNTFLKTVSAFANYNGGTILFGIDDDGKIVGVENVRTLCLSIESKINDSITPQPDYTLELRKNGKVIALIVESGANKPYLYKSKAYKRNDSATIEVEAQELSRLILEGKNIRYEELPASNQELTFHLLQSKVKEVIRVDAFGLDTMKTLNLYHTESGYNKAAEILADENPFPGIDIVRFGENINVIKKRATYANCSILEVFENTMSVFRDYYEYEEIEGAERRKKELIPEEAFRESIANALIHRSWDVESQIRISMFDDRIEISSPGGLPAGITKEEYLKGQISVLRNPILANVFYRLGMVEIFGTGILRIKYLYEKSGNKPKFEISENTIQIILPLYDEHPTLSVEEQEIYDALSRNEKKAMSDIVSSVSFGRSKATGILKEMAERRIVRIEGNGRGTRYYLA